ncbi:MAG: tyrosine-type recombinase/integrase, partial [Chloroflexota bacterium]|nr:tyrosine-type recombinase/integrase [Chloroflexota bacterium]
QKERIVYLNQEAKSALAACQAERPAVDTPQLFLNERGQALTVSGVQWLLTGYGAQIGLHLTPHRLRHTFARRLTEAHMPVESLARLMGHAQISTTQIYLAGADPHLRETFAQAMQAIQATASSAGDPPAPAAAARLSLPDAAPGPLIEPSYPALDDGSRWALDLPAAIRTDCLAYVQRHASAWRPSQRRTCAQNALNELARFFRFVSAQRSLSQVSALSRADLQSYVDALGARGLSAEAICRPVNRILGLLRELDDQGVALAPALFRISRPKKPDSLPRAVCEQEIQRLEALAQSWLAEPTAATARTAACFFVLTHTGLRACELLDLRQSDVDLAQRRVCVRAGKGMRDRVVYLTAVAADALHDYLLLCPHPQTALLLVGDHGQPLTWGWLYNQIRRMGDAVAVSGLTPHRLRHTFATRLINAGVPITSIQKLLGHDQLSTTQIYARVYDTTVEQDYRRAMAQLEQVPPLAL